MIQHRCCAVESKPVELEDFHPPSKIRQQKSQHFPPVKKQRKITADVDDQKLVRIVIVQTTNNKIMLKRLTCEASNRRVLEPVMKRQV